METTEIEKGAIDAIITWVDGSDPDHRLKREAALKQSGSNRSDSIPAGRDDTRFRDNGELKYCISSIRTFAPWIRHIHLVTDNQVPRFLTPGMQEVYGVRIVDHLDIFESYEWALPTFNTRTIESALWRTPGLAPRFIYFNDDFLITKPVEPEDFFRDGKVVYRGCWKPIRNYGPLRLRANRMLNYLTKRLFGITHTMHLLQQTRSARLAGMTGRYFRSPHVPHPVQTGTLREFFKQNPDDFSRNIRFPFRDISQFSAIFLANHLEIRNRNAILEDESGSLMINGETDLSAVIKRKIDKIRNHEIRFLCLQSLEKVQIRQRRVIEQMLDEMFTEPVTEPVNQQ